MKLLTRTESTVVPLRGAYDSLSRRSAVSDSNEMLTGQVHRAVRDSVSDLCLYLRGEFDIHNKHQVAATLASSVAYRTITIDLAETRFIDASIIGVFARFAELRREIEAAQMRIANVNRFIFKLFSICRLNALFCIEEQSRG